jgi:hypothetical protein
MLPTLTVYSVARGSPQADISRSWFNPGGVLGLALDLSSGCLLATVDGATWSVQPPL